MSGPRTVLVVAGHGSRSSEANAALQARAAALGVQLDCPTVAAFLEMAAPSIPDAIAACVAEGAQSIVLLPYFLHPGMHVSRDLTAIVAAARVQYPQVALRITPFFGSHPGIDGLLADIARAALS